MLVKRIVAFLWANKWWWWWWYRLPIYLQQFTSNSEILVRNCNFFLPLAFNAPVGVLPLEFRKKFGPQKTRIMGLPCSEDSLTIGWAVSTQYQRVTDGQTDRRPAYINNVRSMTEWRTLKSELERRWQRTHLFWYQLQLARFSRRKIRLRRPIGLSEARTWRGLKG